MCAGNIPDLNLYVICTHLITCYYDFDIIELPHVPIKQNHCNNERIYIEQITLGIHTYMHICMCHGRRLQSKSLASLIDNT